jgi:hypothetical protein
MEFRKSKWNVQKSGRPRRPNRDEEIYTVLNHERDLGKGGGELIVEGFKKSEEETQSRLDAARLGIGCRTLVALSG